MFAHMFIFPTDLVLLKLLFQVQVVRPMTIGGSPHRLGPPDQVNFGGGHLQTGSNRLNLKSKDQEKFNKNLERKI